MYLLHNILLKNINAYYHVIYVHFTKKFFMFMYSLHIYMFNHKIYIISYDLYTFHEKVLKSFKF